MPRPKPTRAVHPKGSRIFATVPCGERLVEVGGEVLHSTSFWIKCRLDDLTTRKIHPERVRQANG